VPASWQNLVATTTKTGKVRSAGGLLASASRHRMILNNVLLLSMGRLCIQIRMDPLFIDLLDPDPGTVVRNEVLILNVKRRIKTSSKMVFF
jgi:hypothetical protein